MVREDLERAHGDVEKLKNQCESRSTELESLSKQIVTMQENSKELVDRVGILLDLV